MNYKNLFIITGDRDLAVGNTSKCKEEKTKGENGKNAAVNYATILKQPIRTVKPKSDPLYVPPQVSASLNISESSHDITQGYDLFEILQSLGVSNGSILEPDSDCIKGSFSSDSVFNPSKKVLSKAEIKVLEKGLGFSPALSFINEADFKEILMILLGK